MYFKNRAEAGRRIAKRLEKYKAQNTVVVALGEGASIVAAQIAMKLHANLALFMVKNIYLPGENQAIGGLSSGGNFTFNDYFSVGELEELTMEYRGYIETQKMEANHELNVLLGRDGALKKSMLRHRTVIVVSDGLSSGFSMQICADYLKTVAIKRFVAVTPFASVPAVDTIHLISDEIHCLNVVENFFSVNHYYEDNTIPSIEDVVKIMNRITLNWEQVPNFK